MRIAVWHNLPSGGGKRALYEQVRGLVARGHHVEGWRAPSADAGYLPLTDWISETVIPMHRPARRHKWNAYAKRMARLRRLDEHCRLCAAEIDAAGFDLLLAGPCLMTRSAPIARYTRLPSVLYLQEPLRELYECFPQLLWRALPPPERRGPRHALETLRNILEVQGYRVQAREELANAEAFDRILVNSMFSRESVMRAYGLSSSVCYLGVDADRFKPRPVPREDFVVSVGGLAFGKGAERAVRAVAAIEPELRPELVWIGNFENPRYRRAIETLAAERGVVLKVRIRISDDELIDCLSRARLMLYVPVLEPFGLAPLEANACETPVVALAEGGVRETILDGVNGKLVDRDDPPALARAMSELLAHPDRAREIGRQARSHVIDAWGWKEACDRFEHELAVTLATAR